MAFPRGYNSEKHYLSLKISKTTGPMSTKFGTKHPLEKGTPGILIKEQSFLKKKYNWFFPLLINVMI